MKRKKVILLAGVLLLTAVQQADAVERVPGTQTYYSISRDPITDVNTSFMVLPEINDTSSDTNFVVRCSNYDHAELWAWLSSKNELLPQDEADAGIKPAVTIRLGDDPPVVLSDRDVVSVVRGDSTNDTNSIGLNSAIVQRIIAGLIGGKRLVVRINRTSGGQALTYTFSANGVASAWSMLGACGSRLASASNTPATVTPRSGAPAPRFTSWYFTTCTDASSGVVRTGLIAGRAHLCDLVIETVPTGARPVRAEFRYELDYTQAGRSGKLTLDGTDVWPSSGGPITRFRQDGSRLIFTLPLNVRVRPDRVYTSIDVMGTVYFDNGSSKRVYEPLPVRPPL